MGIVFSYTTASLQNNLKGIKFVRKHLEGTDISDFLKLNLQECENPNRYTLKLKFTSYLDKVINDFSKYTNHIYPDSKYFANFRYKCSHLATIGYKLKKGGVKIVQIQSYKKLEDEPPEYLPKKWDKILLLTMKDWTQHFGMEWFSVTRAEDINWYNKPSGSINADSEEEKLKLQKRLKMRYDILAKRCGLKYDEKNKDFRIHF